MNRLRMGRVWAAGWVLLALPTFAKAAARETGAAPETPKVGQKAPDFILKGDDGKSYSLRNQQGRWTVLAFYPADFTKGCTAEACSLRDEKANIEALNARVFGVSVQDQTSHKGFAEKNSLNFRLLVDDRRELASAYGALTGPGGVAKRYTFYIDPAGALQKIDDKVQPFSAGKDVIENLKALQKNEEHPTPSDLNAKIRKLNVRLKENPADHDATSDLALALYQKGRVIMMEPRFSPRIRYPEALKLFNRALNLDPNLAAAQEDKAKIEAMNQQTGQPTG